MTAPGHSYISDKAQLRVSGINRRGIFAVQPIPKNEIISIWGGYVISQQEFGALKGTTFPAIDDYAIAVADGFYLVSNKDGVLEPEDFFNHSCRPNAGMKGHLVLVAMRDIAEGEEITYDYVMTDADFDYAFTCNCGTTDCRKAVTTRDWKRPDLQKKYQNYFSAYVQGKIDAMKF